MLPAVQDFARRHGCSLVTTEWAGHASQLAREALGDLAAYEIGQIAANCNVETAVADRVRLAALQCRASRLAPRRYSERRVNELVGAGGGPVAVEARPPTIDVTLLSPEERGILKKALLRVTGQQSEVDQ